MKYLVLLRGINVGGKRKILMADLRSLFEELGFTDAETYIQSGNVVFENPKNENPMESALRIQDAIRERYGYEVSGMVIPAPELKKAVDQNPYFQTNPEDIKKFYLTFLSDLPEKAKVEAIAEMDFAPDQFVITGNHVFIRCEGKYHESKLTHNFFEKKLGVQATTRNWRTVLKLAEMAEMARTPEYDL